MRRHSRTCAKIVRVSTSPDITALAERICDPARTDVLVVATVRSDTLRPTVDLSAVARAVGDDVEIHLVTTPRASEQLSDLLRGRGMPNVFGGAVRVYGRQGSGRLLTDTATNDVVKVFPNEDPRMGERRLVAAIEHLLARSPRLDDRDAPAPLTTTISLPGEWARFAQQPDTVVPDTAETDTAPSATSGDEPNDEHEAHEAHEAHDEQSTQGTRDGATAPPTAPVPSPALFAKHPATPAATPGPPPARPADQPVTGAAEPDPEPVVGGTAYELLAREIDRLNTRLAERDNQIRNLTERQAAQLAEVRAQSAAAQAAARQAKDAANARAAALPDLNALAVAEARAARLEADNTDLAEQARRAEARARSEAAAAQALRAELAKARKQLASSDADADLPIVYSDPEQQLRYEIEQTWLRTYNEADRAAWPLRDYTVGPDFLASLDTVNVARRKVLEVAVQVITRRAGDVPGREVRKFTVVAGTTTDQRIRPEDEAAAWRANISHRTPQAARFLWWERTDGTPELAKAALHDDTVIR